MIKAPVARQLNLKINKITNVSTVKTIELLSPGQLRADKVKMQFNKSTDSSKCDDIEVQKC